MIVDIIRMLKSDHPGVSVRAHAYIRTRAKLASSITSRAPEADDVGLVDLGLVERDLIQPGFLAKTDSHKSPPDH